MAPGSRYSLFSRKRHINPYKQDVFVEQKYYKEAAARM